MKNKRLIPIEFVALLAFFVALMVTILVAITGQGRGRVKPATSTDGCIKSVCLDKAFGIEYDDAYVKQTSVSTEIPYCHL